VLEKKAHLRDARRKKGRGLELFPLTSEQHTDDRTPSSGNMVTDLKEKRIALYRWDHDDDLPCRSSTSASH
jgi:hypothetical protein